MVNKRKRKNSFNTRAENTREERKGSSFADLITFSFKDLDQTQPKYKPQTLSLWAKDNFLEPLLIHLKELSKIKLRDSIREQRIKIYGDFPEKSKTDFTKPIYIKDDLQWGVITSVGGQKGRLAGYLIESTFYVVFLDKEHKFFKSNKKHT